MPQVAQHQALERHLVAGEQVGDAAARAELLQRPPERRQVLLVALQQRRADGYLGHTADRKDPRVSPLFADLTGMPPILIQVGSDETLLDDALRLAAAAGEADLPVTLEIWPHMIHAWHLWNARLESGRQALGNAGSFMRKHL